MTGCTAKKSIVPNVLTLTGVVLAVTIAVLVTEYVPDDNHVIPPPGVGEPLSVAQKMQGNAHSDQGTIERGRVYYVQLCLSCHGVRGDGMGEWAYRVTPYPRDLRKARTQQRSDQELVDIVSKGLKGTPMIGWQEQLSVTQRKQIVAYLRTLAKTKMVAGTKRDG